MFTRSCPKCGELVHHTNNGNCKRATKKQIICKKCNSKIYTKLFSGSGNPFFGKTHTKLTIDKLKSVNRDYAKTDEFRNTMSKAVYKRNETFNQKSNYIYQVEKHGKAQADILDARWKSRMSMALSGSKNPMYGKPTPIGSGNGWSGWYKGWYFRSLKELSYMILVIEKNNYNWEKGETQKYAVKYKDYAGNDRTYRPDFVINETQIIEIKPKNLFNSHVVESKKKAIEEFCYVNGYTFELVDPTPLKEDDIIKLRTNNLIRFIDRYEQKYKERVELKNETKTKNDNPIGNERKREEYMAQ